MKNQAPHAQKQAGNVLFIILLGIALFAALSYAATQGLRGGGAKMTDETARLQASEYIQYSAKVKDAVRALRINGCLDTQIGFDNSVWTTTDGSDVQGPNHNGNTPSGNTCRVFAPGDGGITPVIFPHSGVTGLTVWNVISGHGKIIRAHIDGIGTSNEDMVLVFYFIPREVCIAINNMLGITNPNGAPPRDDADPEHLYSGDFDNTSGTIGDHEPSLSGKQTFCTEWRSDNDFPGFNYHFYQVLVAR